MNKVRILFVFLLVSTLAILTGCSDDDDIKVTSIVINNIDEGGITLETGDLFVIEALSQPNNAALNGLTYKTSDEMVFTVSAKGEITARNPGVATLTVKSQDGTFISLTRTITVVKKIFKIESIEIEGLTNNTLVISLGTEEAVSYKLNPLTANEGVVFESSDESVFTVDSKGNLLGLKQDVAELTISAQSNPAIKATCKVEVEIFSITSIVLPPTLTIKSGTTFNLNSRITILPANASIKKLNYALSNDAVISISEDGIITPIKTGTVTLTATTTDGTDLSVSSVITVSSELDNTNWDVTCSDETASDGGGRMTILDESTHETYWHSQWGPDEPMPHWLIIDMQKEQAVGKVLVGRRYQDGNTNTDTRLVKISVSTNGTDFTDVGQIDFGTSDKKDLDKTISFTPVKVRYIKLLITESNRDPFVNVAVFKAYTE